MEWRSYDGFLGHAALDAAVAARGVIDTRGIGDLVRDLGRIDKTMRAALVKELRHIGDEARDRVRSSTEAPYGPVDSKGEVGRKRKSVKTSVRRGTIALVSKEPDANVWHWGGSISPRGVKINIPRTEFVAKEVRAAGDHVDERLGLILEGAAFRNGFH